MEQLDDRGALCPGIAALPATDMVGGDAALPVGRTGQGNQGLAAGYKVSQFHSVTYGIDIWVRGDHVLIDHDGALGSKGQTSLSCQVGFWSDTDGQQHQVRGDRGAVLY